MIKKIKIIWNKIFGRDIDYKKYWNDRYSDGDTSGSGSYGVLSDFKANIINEFVSKNNIETVIDFGCGDGNQLKKTNYKKYLGLDVADSSIKICNDLFKNDKTKSFIKYNPMVFFNNEFLLADLVLSLDVLYHIISEDEFVKTLEDIFSCAKKYIILYTSINGYKQYSYEVGTHIRHRDIITYLSKFSNIKIIKVVPQQYKDLSCADFIFLEKETR